MEPKEPQEPQSMELENKIQEKDPYSGIFFEVDVLMEQAKVSCIERLRPLVSRELGADELFACLEVFNYQDFGLNYNTFSKNGDEIDVNLEQFGDITAIPGLEEHIESHLDGKTTSKEQNKAFDEKMRKRLFDFFSDCWKQAGGGQAKVPTFFCFEEEEDQLMDFETGTVFSQEEIASKLESRQ